MMSGLENLVGNSVVFAAALMDCGHCNVRGVRWRIVVMKRRSLGRLSPVLFPNLVAN